MGTTLKFCEFEGCPLPGTVCIAPVPGTRYHIKTAWKLLYDYLVVRLLVPAFRLTVCPSKTVRFNYGQVQTYVVRSQLFKTHIIFLGV